MFRILSRSTAIGAVAGRGLAALAGSFDKPLTLKEVK
jgi:hypothetical protein